MCSFGQFSCEALPKTVTVYIPVNCNNCKKTSIKAKGRRSEAKSRGIQKTNTTTPATNVGDEGETKKEVTEKSCVR